MINEIAHVGITVSNLQRSVSFYKDVLGLNFINSMTMKGKETDLLFNQANCVVHLAYLSGSDQLLSPPIELIHFALGDCKADRADLYKTSISEICFRVKDIDAVYKSLKEKQVDFLSEPQYFDYTNQGFGKSKAVYFRDPDGIILELIEDIESSK